VKTPTKETTVIDDTIRFKSGKFTGEISKTDLGQLFEDVMKICPDGDTQPIESCKEEILAIFPDDHPVKRLKDFVKIIDTLYYLHINMYIKPIAE
jgi:hypothetical protein